jgi:hypothetical protein
MQALQGLRVREEPDSCLEESRLGMGMVEDDAGRGRLWEPLLTLQEGFARHVREKGVNSY